MDIRTDPEKYWKAQEGKTDETPEERKQRNRNMQRAINEYNRRIRELEEETGADYS